MTGTAKERFEQFSAALETIDKLGEGFKSDAIEYAQFVLENDPKNLLESHGYFEYFLSARSSFYFDQEDSGDYGVTFTSHHSYDPERVRVPERWFTDTDRFKELFLEQLEAVEKKAADKKSSREQKKKEKDFAEYKRLKAIYG